jgi:type I restriction enzyme S subunit
MIAELKPYPEYKESGLSWLEQVPSTWKVVRNGSLFGQRNQTGYEELPILEVSLNTGVRVRDFQNSTRKQVMSDLGKYKRAAKGDVAYNMMRMWQGAVGVSPVDGLVSPAYVVARPYPQVEPRFFVALFRTGAYMSEIDNCSRGIVKDRNRLYWGEFKQILSPCPPPAEQAAIVQFLDWANGQLDRAIRAKRRVIALLNEQKQAIIHHAVLRGLDPSASLKPSGISWLEKIPTHWEIRRGKDLFREVDQRSKAGLEELLSVSHITGVTPRSQKNITMFKAASYAGSKLCMPGDLVINTMWAWMGALSVSRYEGIVSPSYGVYRPKNASGLTSDYADYLLRTRLYVAEYTVRSTGITSSRLRLYPEQFLRVPILLPPEKEQESIAHYIVAETKGLDRAILTADREIALLREYRTRLVADVVTGKLDVRETAAHLPDDAELADEEAVA